MTSRLLTPADGTILVTHKNCLDGTGCALVFLLAGGKRESILFRSPSDCSLELKDLPSGTTEIWFADCCPRYLTGVTCGLPFKVFDHHVSNERRHGNSFIDIHFDSTKCGTTLLSSYMKKPLIKRWIDADRVLNAIEAYDLGRFDERDGINLADLASTTTQDAMLSLLLCDTDILSDDFIMARAFGAGEARKIYAQHAAENARYIQWENTHKQYIRLGVAVSPLHYKNSTAQSILNSDKADVAVIIDITNQMASLRSLPGGPDCSEIASLYGGGGHERAAGFRIDSQILLKLLIQEVFE